MLSYCLHYRKIQKVKTQTLQRQKNGRIILLSNCAVCESKEPKFVNEQEASELLSSTGIKTPLSKIPLVGPLLL